ncbi:MAG: glyoxalase [Bacteroidia bacterium]|nr:glyoxalase [Bacteroidia bacterium]
MNIKMTSVHVNDPLAAYTFYTEILGFVKIMYMPEANLAIVAASSDPGDTALLLEPASTPYVKTYQESLYRAGLPSIVFDSDDIKSECKKLKGLGVKFIQDVTVTEWGIIAQFDDTCGNYIQIHQS